MDYKLTKSEIIKLIKLYKSHSLLWDIKNRNYKRNDLKTAAYEKIASEMGLPTDILRKKLISLRSTYTGERRKIHLSIISGAVGEEYVPNLSWYKEMNFLENSIDKRRFSYEGGCNKPVIKVFNQVGCNGYFSNESPSKHRKKEKSNMAKSPEIDHDMFADFAKSISSQLRTFPEEDAYILMAEMQNLLAQHKLETLRIKVPYTTHSDNSN